MITMRALIINMDGATDRMAFMQAQMETLGLDWERVPAVTPGTLHPPEADPVWHRWQRPMRVTEMALCASHMAAWRRVLALDAPCLVLEDDAWLARDLPDHLGRFAALTGIDHISLETRSRRKLVARRPHHAAAIRRLYLDRTGSAAMVVWPSGARKLLAAAARAGAPSDALISGCRGLVSYQADPALSIQLDQAEAYGRQAPMAAPSLIDRVAKPPPRALALGARLAYRARRWGAQIAMAARIVAHWRGAERCGIAATDNLVSPDLS